MSDRTRLHLSVLRIRQKVTSTIGVQEWAEPAYNELKANGSVLNADSQTSLGSKRVRLVILGRPGSGKGTQGKQFCSELGIPWISTGDIFRAAIAEGSELGIKAIIRRRIELFYQRTIPIMEYYDPRGRLLKIDGNQLPAALHQDILKALIVDSW